jgi:hypothetical protein
LDASPARPEHPRDRLADEDEWSDEVRERLQQGPPAGKERYMLLICSDGITTDAKRETMQRELPQWVERMTASGALIAGSQLAGPDTAELVRVRGPHTLVSDGPLVETKEFIAGFDVIDCTDLGRGGHDCRRASGVLVSHR